MLDAHLVADLRRLVMEESAADGQRPGGVARNGGQRKLYRFFERDPDLMLRLITHPGLLGPLTSLLGPNVVFVRNRHNQASINAPGESEARLHRDVLQWSRNLVTAVVYLEDSTPTNGCTYLIPASHYAPFMGVPQPDGGGTWMDEHEEFRDLMDQALPVPVPEGGVLLFDSLAFHSVGANHGTTNRASIVLGYRSVDELEREPAKDTEILVAGQYIYRGNDRR